MCCYLSADRTYIAVVRRLLCEGVACAASVSWCDVHDLQVAELTSARQAWLCVIPSDVHRRKFCRYLLPAKVSVLSE